MRSILSFLGRVCISSIFVFTAMQDILEWNSREQIFYTTISLKLHTGGGFAYFKMLLEIISSNFPMFFAFTIFLKLYGGASLLLAWKVRFGAFLLLLYLVPATFFLHDFWNKAAIGREVELILFGKNLAIIGGLFLLLAQSSMDKKEKKVDRSDDRSK